MGTRNSPRDGDERDVSAIAAHGSRRGWVIACVVGAGLSVWATLAVDAAESNRHSQLFALWANERAQLVTAQLETIAADVPTFQSFYENSETVTNDEFVRFARDWTRRHPGIVRVAWMAAEGSAATPFVEPAMDVESRDAMLARPEISAACARARELGRPTCTTPMRENGPSRVVVHLVAPVAVAQQESARHKGFIVVSLCPTDTIEAALHRSIPVGLDMTVTDVSDSSTPLLVAERPSNAPQSDVPRSAGRTTTRAPSQRHETTIEFADRLWRTTVDATQYFDRLRRSWIAPSVLAGGAILTGLLALHLGSVASRGRLVERLVRQRTAQLERANAELDEHRALLEQRVAERTRQLADANHELEAFSYSVSHDLRAPLRAIDGFSGLLLAKTETVEKLDPEAVRRLGVIRRNVRQMGQLIDDLLAFSKLSRVELTRREVDMNALVRSCIDSLAHDREGRNLEIRVHDLPSCHGDESLLREVWLNLLSNAIKYTRLVPFAHVDVRAENVDGRTEYVVRDDGVGFDMRYVHKLFGVFQRLHRAEDYPGTGVGLALVRRIVRRHGGDVSAKSEPGNGATFRFWLDEVNHD